MEPQTTEEPQSQTVHLHDNRSSTVYATSSIMIFLTSVAVVLRLYCRRKLRLRIGPDDFAILIALVSSGWINLKKGIRTVKLKASSKILSYGLCVELMLGQFYL